MWVSELDEYIASLRAVNLLHCVQSVRVVCFTRTLNRSGALSNTSGRLISSFTPEVMSGRKEGH